MHLFINIKMMEEHYLESITSTMTEGRVLDLRSYLQLVQLGYCYKK